MTMGERVCRWFSAELIWYAQRMTSATLYTPGSIVARVTSARRSPPVSASMQRNGTTAEPGTEVAGRSPAP